MSGIAGDEPSDMMGGLSKVAALAAPGVGLRAVEPLVSMLPGTDVDETADDTQSGPNDRGSSANGIQGANEVLIQEGVLVTLSMNDHQLVDTAERVLDESGATLLTRAPSGER